MGIAAALSRAPPALKQVNDEDGEGQDQEDVDESTEGGGSGHTE